jgi:hypothetical protein
MKISKSVASAVPNQEPVIFTARSRNGVERIMTKGDVRHVRKAINKGRTDKLTLDMDAETINRLCRWSKPISESDLKPVILHHLDMTEAAPEPVIAATTASIEAPAEAPAKAKRKPAAKKPAAKKKIAARPESVLE